VLKIVRHVTASFTELWSTALRSALWFSCRHFRALDERIHAACDSEEWAKAIYRGRPSNFPSMYHFATIDRRVHFGRCLSRTRWQVWLSFFSFLKYAIHNAAAHLNRFAIIRVILASRMVGAMPQLPPCCIAAGCSPATEMYKSTLVLLSSIPFWTFMIFYDLSIIRHCFSSPVFVTCVCVLMI